MDGRDRCDAVFKNSCYVFTFSKKRISPKHHFGYEQITTTTRPLAENKYPAPITQHKSQTQPAPPPALSNAVPQSPIVVSLDQQTSPPHFGIQSRAPPRPARCQRCTRSPVMSSRPAFPPGCGCRAPVCSAGGYPRSAGSLAGLGK